MIARTAIPFHSDSLRFVLTLTVVILVSGSPASSQAAGNESADRGGPIPIAELHRESAVDFNKEILPLLKNNCLACHNRTTAKAGLILETPADMLKGGDSGPAVVARKGASSLLLKAASHQLEDTLMPPLGNKVQASDLSPEELALIRLWIDQGAIASASIRREIDWQPLPPGLNPIYAVALTPDGQFAACGRANQIFLYHLPTRRLVTRLTDPALAATNGTPGTAHRDLVQSLAFSPDGALLASGGYREVKLWRRPLDTQKLHIPRSAHASITSVAVSPTGEWFATGTADGRIRLWTLATGQPAKALPRHKGPVNSLEFSPDGTLLCSGSSDKTVRVWQMPEGKLIAQTNTGTEINAAVWLPDGHQIATGGTDQIIRIWDLVPNPARLNLVKELRGHEQAVTSLKAFSSTNEQILSGSQDGTVRVWNVAEASQVRELKHDGPVTSVAIRPDGKRFASAGLDHLTKLWDAADGKLIAELQGERHAQEYVVELEQAAAFATNEVRFQQTALKSAETNQVAQTDRVKKAVEADDKAAKGLAESQQRLAEARDAKTSAEKSVEDTKAELKKAMESADLTDAGTKPAAANTAAVSSGAGTKEAGGKLITELKEQEKRAAEKVKAASKKFIEAEADLKKTEQPRSNAETELQLAHKALASAEQAAAKATNTLGNAERTQKDSEVALKYARLSAAQHLLPVRTVAFSPDNLTLATSGDDRLTHTWSAENGTPFETFQGQGNSVVASAFTPDGALVTAGADGSIEVWDLNAPWTLARVIGGGDANSPLADRVSAVKFSPDGRRLATGGGQPTRGGEIKLWDSATGRELRSYTNIHSDVVFALDFSRDGKYLATAASDRFAKVIDLDTGNVVKQFEGHTHHVLGVSWKRDGRTLASAGADNLIKVWDFLTGERKKNITGSDKEVTSISFIGYTDQALATSGEGRVRLIRDDGTEVRSFPGASDFVYSAATTADGRLVVAGGQDSVLRVWNGNDGQLIVSFPPPEK